ncbi:TOPRIM nucleotidyl transferase/hydrolase domain-containing protein [Agromyces bauzanensis]
MRAQAFAESSATVVLVEGDSDRFAVEALALRFEVDLVAASATVVSMNGVTNLHRHLAELARGSARRRVVGLFDLPEIAHVRRAVEGAGLAQPGTDLASLGFFACDPDLEGELIRALGSDRVEGLLADHGELERFRGFQRQPAQRAKTAEAQLRRFMGTHSGRKARFAPILVGALEPSRVPIALSGLLDAAITPPSSAGILGIG